MKLKLLFLSSLVIAGCGGGGGGGANSSITAFVKHSEIEAGDEIRFSNGRSIEGEYIWDSDSDKITSSSSSSHTTLTADVTYGTGDTPAERVDNSAVTVNVARTGGENLTFDCATDTCGYLIADPTQYAYVTANGEDYLIGGDRSLNNDYVSYGTWITGAGTGSGTFGVFAVGNETPTSSMPSAGSGSYAGTSNGFYIDSDGDNFYTVSDIGVNVNFATGVLTLNSSNTQASANLTNWSNDTSLDFTATGSINSGTNSFDADATSVGAGINTLSTGGEFFGPNAENIGGTWKGIDGATSESYVGAFGGR